MPRRFVTIWFRHLKTDWHRVHQPALRLIPFVLVTPDHGHLIITAANQLAENEGILPGMPIADALAILPTLHKIDDDPILPERLLKSIAHYCIRYTDTVAIDPPGGLILDVTGCAHLWGGESNYIKEIHRCLKNRGYDLRITMADTIGASWAITHYGSTNPIVAPAKQIEALLTLPPPALRLDPAITERLVKLGLRKIHQFIQMPRSALRRRFGPELLLRLDQALGNVEETIVPVYPPEPFRERLPCLEPIITSTGIDIALVRLLETICTRLQKEGLGIRQAVFHGYRVDNKIEKIGIGTSRATANPKHLFKLFAEKISSIEPSLGIELFMIEALKTEKLFPKQEQLWSAAGGFDNPALTELMDRLTNRFGTAPFFRFIPDEHHWPERSFKATTVLFEPINSNWVVERPRPINILSKPASIEVTAPIPDYPPMLFRYQGTLHKIIKADGPERIESEWWIAESQHRDYYIVEDEAGGRYWIFRAGHYDEVSPPKWFLHGFFA